MKALNEQLLQNQPINAKVSQLIASASGSTTVSKTGDTVLRERNVARKYYNIAIFFINKLEQFSGRQIDKTKCWEIEVGRLFDDLQLERKL